MYIREVVARSCSVKKLFLEISQNSQERTCARVSFFNKVAELRLWHRCFPMNFAKFLRTSFLTEHLRWLLPIKVVLNKLLLPFGTQFWDALRNVLTTSCLKAWICQNAPKKFCVRVERQQRCMVKIFLKMFQGVYICWLTKIIPIKMGKFFY